MIKYEFIEKDYKKYLKSKRRNTNIAFLVLGTLIYFYVTYYLIFNSPLEAFGFYGLYIVVLIIVICLFNELYYFINIRNNQKKNIFGDYEVKVDKDKISVKVNGKSNIYLNSDIKKIKTKKKYTIVKYKNRTYLLLMKSYFKDEEEYEKFFTYYNY